MVRNQTKIRILEILYDNSIELWWSSSQIAEAAWLSQTNVSELLRRYARQGLVHRWRNPAVPKGYLYRLSEAGYERLVYLQELAELENYELT